MAEVNGPIWAAATAAGARRLVLMRSRRDKVFISPPAINVAKSMTGGEHEGEK
jgi:hypothetical protein